MADNILNLLSDELTPEEWEEFRSLRNAKAYPILNLLIEMCKKYGVENLRNALLVYTGTGSYELETDELQIEGQHHLELDESTLESIGKSVSVEEVLAKIDEALETDKE